MFRKPRQSPSDARSQSTPLSPSVGRPPTPPTTPAKTPFSLAIPPGVPALKMPARTTPARKMPLPVIGRQGFTGNGKRTAAAATAATKGKASGKGNGSILSFFKKAEEGVEVASLFVEERRGMASELKEEALTPVSIDNGGWEDQGRFNEHGGSVKRRRISLEVEQDELFGDEDAPVESATAPIARSNPGPFMEDSDSDDDDSGQAETTVTEEMVIPKHSSPESVVEGIEDASPHAPLIEQSDPPKTPNGLERPPLVKEETSYGTEMDEFKDFEGMDDFDEDLYEEGDEYMERKYEEEQARLEAEANDADYGPSTEHPQAQTSKIPTPPEDETAACPICGVSLGGVKEQDAEVHVNNCLDGNPTPLPKTQQSFSPPITKTEGTASASHYKRPVRAPKPGQANPFILGEPSTAGGSAFNKLMSGHAEDAAWAEAAAAENASRGKPAYQRTCPFYKILPGLFICVDAFRYGAVQGCQAYFLSHFHSDHYVGLTSHWSHGPIYCSRVTANLVRQQLRVDPKYVIDLEFEKPIEVPGTKGVKVTMIPANHCPGSSLYLFEKAIGKKTNGEPRLQRILHCGDFRACRAHVEHPLLMPEVCDQISGKTKEQKIDVCYLDTTYLNPKYAFPSQEMVIRACAEMCVSLSKHTIDESDGWEQMKRQRAGEGMVKFVQRDSDAAIKEELAEEGDDLNRIKLVANPAASQTVLSTRDTPDSTKGRGRLLVVVGTYSIGKERICLGIAKALDSKIYAPPSKMRIVAALEDPELDARMTSDPRAAQVHMTPLFEIRAETLDDYLKDYFPHFTRAVGFRPSGWNYRPPTSRFLESPSVATVLNGDNWKSAYSMKDLVPQRGSSSRASCFGVPYSEHSSFRELTMFCCGLRIEKIIPTVNVGSAKSRERMKAWIERWAQEKRKTGLWQLPADGSW